MPQNMPPLASEVARRLHQYVPPAPRTDPPPRYDARSSSVAFDALRARQPGPPRRPRPPATRMDRDPIREPRSVEPPRGDGGRRYTPWNLSDVRGHQEPRTLGRELRSRALDAVERMPAASDATRAAATRFLEEQHDEPGRLARMMLTLSDPLYLRAWSKVAADPVMGPALLSDLERRSLFTTTPRIIARELRAMSLSDVAGGYLVPLQLDPTLTIAANGSVNQIRRVARQVVAVGSKWRGPTSAAAAWSYDAEAAEVSDDAATVAMAEVPLHKAQGYVPISMELFDDADNATEQVATVLAEGRTTLEAQAFAVGSGIGAPTGIVTALTGTSSVVASATTDTFALADLYAMVNALPARHSMAGSTAWLANPRIYSRARQFDTAGGAELWTTQSAGTAPLLIDRPALVAEAMDGVLDPGQDNPALVVGDFSQFVIADRLGTVVDFIPHVPGPNRRPAGQRAWLAHARHGSDCLNDAAFRLLVV